MKTARTFIILAAVLLAALSSRLSAQGYYWESTVSGGPGGEHIAKTFMMPKFFKVEQDGKEALVTNLQKKIILRINDAEKTYSEMTFEEMEARLKTMGGKTDAKMAELHAKMKEMPEEQRKMMEKMMGPMAGGSGTIDVKKSTEKKTIAGLSCTKFEVTQQDGKTLMTVWATKELKGFDRIRADWEEFSKRMTDQMPGQFGKSIAAGMKKIDGFPMETEMGPVVSTVTKIEQRATPASAFEAPAGYTKVDEPPVKPKDE